MIQKFLTAKHWQLFSITFGIPLILQIIMMGTVFSDIENSNPSEISRNLQNYQKFFPIMMMIFAGVFFGWFWSVAVGLQTKIPEEARMKLLRFKVFLLIPMVYILAISITINGFPDAPSNESSSDLFGRIFTFVVLLHFFSMFCIFHSLYFAAKAIKTAEVQRKVSFSDFVGEFFLIWFFPIGIWILQPRINKLVGEEKSSY